MGPLRDPQVPCVCVCAPSLPQHIQIEKALTSEHLEIQETLEMKYRKLLCWLNPWHIYEYFISEQIHILELVSNTDGSNSQNCLFTADTFIPEMFVILKTNQLQSNAVFSH